MFTNVYNDNKFHKIMDIKVKLSRTGYYDHSIIIQCYFRGINTLISYQSDQQHQFHPRKIRYWYMNYLLRRILLLHDIGNSAYQLHVLVFSFIKLMMVSKFIYQSVHKRFFLWRINSLIRDFDSERWQVQWSIFKMRLSS